MNSGIKFGLFFLGGIALGALGAVALSKGKLNLKPVAADLISRGMDVKDALMSKVEAVKEDMEDLAAEAVRLRKSAKRPKRAKKPSKPRPNRNLPQSFHSRPCGVSRMRLRAGTVFPGPVQGFLFQTGARMSFSIVHELQGLDGAAAGRMRVRASPSPAPGSGRRAGPKPGRTARHQWGARQPPRGQPAFFLRRSGKPCVGPAPAGRP